MLTADRLREILTYDPATGAFSRGGRVLRPKANAGGYLRVFVDGKLYYAHRLAWLYITGVWPHPEIDHRNGVKSDNRFCNLREATSSQNKCAVKRSVGASGVRGVRRHRGRWQAVISVRGRSVPLGTYDSPCEAGAVYKMEAIRVFGEFAG